MENVRSLGKHVNFFNNCLDFWYFFREIMVYEDVYIGIHGFEFCLDLLFIYIKHLLIVTAL